MDVSLSWLAAVVNLDETGVSPYSLSDTSRRLLLKERGEERQTGHNDYVVKDEESPRYYFTVTGEVSAHLYVTALPHLCLHYIGARKTLLTEAAEIEQVQITPTSFFVGSGYVQHAGGRVARKTLHMVSQLPNSGNS